MKTHALNRKARLLFILLLAFLYTNSDALYLGWKEKKVERYLARHAGYRIDKVNEGSAELTYVFEEGNGIRKMVFYFNGGECSAYLITYELRFGRELKEFLEDRYTYNRERDYYEDRKSLLYYRGGRTNHEIYITDKESFPDPGISMK